MPVFTDQKEISDAFAVSTEPILSPELIASYASKPVPWGFNGLGWAVYKRTYSRTKPDGSTEEWHETIGRCINGAQKIGAGYTQDEAERLFDHIFNLRCCFAGRMLWQLGTSTVDRFGLPSLMNCYYVSMTEPEDFCFVFEHLMLGGGVGFSVRKAHIHELPRAKKGVDITHQNTKDAQFIVPDSREGWVELLRKVLDSFFRTGQGFTYSTILLRGAGEVIKSFGGVASGPAILIEGIAKITRVLQSREGKKLRSVDVLDINNIIGSIVVSGNVRRSAELAIGDPDDHLYLRAKSWSLGDIPNWRGMSNNSIDADSYDHIADEVWETGYKLDPKTGKAKGEPYGFINMQLSRRCGRLGEYVLDPIEGYNPCAEAGLEDGEACNLSELFTNNVRSAEELIDCSTLLYKTQKCVWTLPTISRKTAEVGKRNMRLAQGVTGLCQSHDKLPWLDQAYVALREYDRQWSEQRGWPASIKLTSVKPSGSLSLLAGSTPGVHPAYARHYIRRVRMSSQDKLVALHREAGYHVEYVRNFDNTEDHGTVVVEFPCEAGDDAIIADDMSAVRQLDLVKQLQTVWSDNSVSVTVYYRPHELDEIRAWMKEHYADSLKTVSFLLHDEHGFVQAPYEKITKERYLELLDQIEPIKRTRVEEGEDLQGIDCATGGCPLK